MLFSRWNRSHMQSPPPPLASHPDLVVHQNFTLFHPCLSIKSFHSYFSDISFNRKKQNDTSLTLISSSPKCEPTSLVFGSMKHLHSLGIFINAFFNSHILPSPISSSSTCYLIDILFVFFVLPYFH